MTSIPHLDPCLNPDRYQEILPTLPYTNGRGEYTIGTIEFFDQQFRNTIAQEVTTNPLTKAVNTYGNEVVYQSVDQINEFLRRPYVLELLPNYPVLSARLQEGTQITPFEFTQFMQDFYYTPISAINFCNSSPISCLEQLEAFYTGSFSKSVMGGFCSLFPNIFGAIGGFFNLIGKVEGLIKDALTFINKIKNIEDPIKALFEKIKVKALIEAIKEKIVKTVEGIINKVKSAIENFDPGQIVSQIQTFVRNGIGRRITQLKERIAATFTKENMEKILGKVRGLIDYAVGLFENPNIEEIQFLIMRLCGFASGIEGLINSLKNPLDDFADNFQNIARNLELAGNRVTGRVVDAGGIRFPPETAAPIINNERIRWELAGDVPPINDDERRDLPSWQTLLDGGNEYIDIVGARWVTHPLMRPNNEGWDRMDPDFRCLLMRLIKDAKNTGLVSGKVFLNSGYRNNAYNEFVGGANGSNHTRFIAADISWSGGRYGSSSNREALIEMAQMARRKGITGRGFYPSFIHLAMSRENFTRRGDISVS